MSVHEERETPARTLHCADSVQEREQQAKRLKYPGQKDERTLPRQAGVQQSNSGLEETGGVWKGMTRKKKLRCKVTARNRREEVIFVSEVSWGRHEGIQL